MRRQVIAIILELLEIQFLVIEGGTNHRGNGAVRRMIFRIEKHASGFDCLHAFRALAIAPFVAEELLLRFVFVGSGDDERRLIVSTAEGQQLIPLDRMRKFIEHQIQFRRLLRRRHFLKRRLRELSDITAGLDERRVIFAEMRMIFPIVEMRRSLDEGFVIFGRNIELGKPRVDDRFILPLGKEFLAPIENGIDAVLNRQFSTKRLVKLLQEEYGGLSTGRAERLTSELNDRADFESTQQNAPRGNEGAGVFIEKRARQNERGNSERLEQLRGALDEQRLDLRTVVGDFVEDREMLLCFFGEMRFEGGNGVRRIGGKNVETPGQNFFAEVEIHMIVEPVTEHDIAEPRAMHEQRDFRDARESVIFFDAVEFRADPFRIGLGVEISADAIVDGFKALRQKMPRAASVIDDARVNHLAVFRADFLIERQAIPYETRERNRREELPLVLLETVIEKLLEEIAEELKIFRADDPISLEKPNDLDEDFAVLPEQFFIVNFLKRELVVCKEFQSPNGLIEFVDQFLPRLPHVAVQNFFDIIIADIENVLAHELLHAFRVQSLQTILQRLESIRADLVLKFDFGVFGFGTLVGELADEQCRQSIEGIFFVRNIVMTKDLLKFVDDAIFLLEVDEIFFQERRLVDAISGTVFGKDHIAAEFLLESLLPHSE